MHDGGDIDETALGENDFYFKRSFAPSHAATLGGGAKIFPYGLNYLVYTDESDKFLTARRVLQS